MGRPLEPAWMIDEYHRRQTKPGAMLDNLLHGRFIPEADRILGKLRVASAATDENVSISLLHICIDVFVGGMLTAFLGKKQMRDRKANAAWVESFLTWERTSWKYMFRMPKLLSRDTLGARDEMINIFVRYLGVPPEERDDATYFVKETERMLRDARCGDEDIARVLVLHFWT
jgi:hypothetical protein